VERPATISTDLTRTTRRGFLALGTAAGAGLALTACSPDPIPDHGISAKVGQTPIPSVADPIAALNDVLDKVVNLTAFAYQSLAPVVDPSLQGLVTSIRSEHVAQGARLAAAITALGGTPVATRPTYQFAGSNPVPTASADAVKLLQTLEDAAVKKFYLLAAGFAKADLVQLSAGCMAADAQHSSALLDRLGLSPLPDAFVSA
jgi:hypothetical protein